MSEQEEITFNLWTRTDLGAAECAQGFLDVLRSAGEGWVPVAFGRHEPLRRPKGPVSEALTALWSESDGSEHLIGHVLFRTGRSVGASGTLYWNRHPHSEFNSVSISLPLAGYPAHEAEFWKLAESLFLWTKACYGTAWSRGEFLAQHRNPHPGDTLLCVSPGPYLPGVYFANFFGSELVSFFGEDRLRSCPGIRNELFGKGSHVITTASSPSEWDTPEAGHLKAEVRRHLGENAFFDVRDPDRPTVRPFKALAGGDPESHPDRSPRTPVSKSIFESEEAVHAFLGDIMLLAGRLRARVPEAELDYTPESLRDLEDALLRRDAAIAGGDKQGLLEVAAYFGEVLRRNLNGNWILDRGSTLPAVRLPDGRLEHPIVRALKLHESGDLLSDWYDFANRGGESLLS
jgi:hypothetical protein